MRKKRVEKLIDELSDFTLTETITTTNTLPTKPFTKKSMQRAIELLEDSREAFEELPKRGELSKGGYEFLADKVGVRTFKGGNICGFIYGMPIFIKEGIPDDEIQITANNGQVTIIKFRNYEKQN